MWASEARRYRWTLICTAEGIGSPPLKWVRAQLASTQLSTYFVGYQEHCGLRPASEKTWADKFTLNRYHDGTLSFGSPPVRFEKALLLNEPIPECPSFKKPT